jgi:hypothetical protein
MTVSKVTNERVRIRAARAVLDGPRVNYYMPGSSEAPFSRIAGRRSISMTLAARAFWEYFS